MYGTVSVLFLVNCENPQFLCRIFNVYSVKSVGRPSLLYIITVGILRHAFGSLMCGSWLGLSVAV